MRFIFLFPESKVTAVTFGKPLNFTKYESLSGQEPRLVTADLASPLGRRLHRQVKLNDEGDLFIVWWSMGDQEVYPWTPQLKVSLEDIHIYPQLKYFWMYSSPYCTATKTHFYELLNTV
jgi:hypothetical protein